MNSHITAGGWEPEESKDFPRATYFPKGRRENSEADRDYLISLLCNNMQISDCIKEYRPYYIPILIIDRHVM